jgi:hypothetical protein
MAKYTGAGTAGAANSTTANAGIIQVAQGSTVKDVKLYEWEISPGGAAADNNYQVQWQRQTTKGTWTTTVTSAPLAGPNALAANSTCYLISTVAGSLVSNSVLLSVGFNQRAGYRWVAVPGGEITLAPTTLYNVFLSYFYAQGTDVFYASASWDE